jgi:hypothetical protein
MTQARRELDGRIDHALGVASRVRARVAEFERRVGPPAPPTDEDVARLRTFVLGHARTEQWQPVLDRIDRGELTWREVAEGLACGGADRDVAAAFAALAHAPAAGVAELVELGIFPARVPGLPPAGKRAVEADTGADEDEQWFDENPLGLPRR